MLREAHTPASASFFDGLAREEDRLFGPGLLLAECTSVIREKVFDKILTDDEAIAALEVALSLGIAPVTDIEQHRKAFDYAGQRSKKNAYDEHYIAAAALTGSRLVTVDSGMYQGAVNLRIPARLLR